MITLRASPLDDDSYRCKAGRLSRWNNDGVDGFDLLNDLEIICGPDDVIVFEREDLGDLVGEICIPVNMWELIEQTNLTSLFKKDSACHYIVNSHFLTVVDSYYRFDGYAGLSLNEYVKKMYN